MRPVIIIGHDVKYLMEMLSWYLVELNDRQQFPLICGFLDTQILESLFPGRPQALTLSGHVQLSPPFVGPSCEAFFLVKQGLALMIRQADLAHNQIQYADVSDNYRYGFRRALALHVAKLSVIWHINRQWRS